MKRSALHPLFSRIESFDMIAGHYGYYDGLIAMVMGYQEITQKINYISNL